MKWMRTTSRAAAAVALIAGLLLPLPALAEDEVEPEAPPAFPPAHLKYAPHAFDAAVLRPLGFVAATVGAVAFVPVAIITSPGGLDALNEALDLFVLVPGRWVFTRPLGEF